MRRLAGNYIKSMVCKGKEIKRLSSSTQHLRKQNRQKGQPTVLIANTVKGKGSAVMENKAAWHHHVPSQEEYEQIMKDLKREKRKETAVIMK